MKPVVTVGELEAALANYPTDTPIAGFWENQEEVIYVCQDHDGMVLLDVDGGWKAKELEGK